VTGDAYRARVRAMTALDHFATDHLPLAVFAFAVLAMHQTRQPVYSGTAMCSCGQSVVTCPVQSLARRLLFAPTPAPQVEAADRGGTA
jgi:hypothetical protein